MSPKKEEKDNKIDINTTKEDKEFNNYLINFKHSFLY